MGKILKKITFCQGLIFFLDIYLLYNYYINQIYAYILEGGNMERQKDRDKFVELAGKRVSKAIKDIRLIANLSNKSNYSYTDEDVRKIIRALDAEVKKLKQRFETQGVSEEIVFKL